MRLTSYEQYATLDSWNFIQFWRVNRTALVALGRRAYTTLQSRIGDPWLRAESLVRSLALALTGARIFNQKCESYFNEGVKRELKPVWAEALARYIIDMDWPVIAMVTGQK